MIGKAIYNMLANAAAVTAIVSTKIYPEIAPEGTVAPCVIFDVSNITPVYDRSGLAYDNSTVDIDMFVKDYTDSIDLLVAVRAAVERRHGTFNGVEVSMADIQSIVSGWDPASETFWWRITIQFNNL